MNIFINPQDNSVQILIVEDDSYAKENIAAMLRKSFPLATVHVLSNFFVENVEEMITKNQYHAIFLDASLNGWVPHPSFGNYGGNIIPYIKEHSIKSVIVAISSDNGFNEGMLKLGATKALNKNHLQARGTTLDSKLNFIK